MLIKWLSLQDAKFYGTMKVASLLRLLIHIPQDIFGFY